SRHLGSPTEVALFSCLQEKPRPGAGAGAVSALTRSRIHHLSGDSHLQRSRRRAVRVVSVSAPGGAVAKPGGLAHLCRCQKSGVWPGPGGERRDAEEIWLPDWHRQQMEARYEAT